LRNRRFPGSGTGRRQPPLQRNRRSPLDGPGNTFSSSIDSHPVWRFKRGRTFIVLPASGAAVDFPAERYRNAGRAISRRLVPPGRISTRGERMVRFPYRPDEQPGGTSSAGLPGAENLRMGSAAGRTRISARHNRHEIHGHRDRHAGCVHGQRRQLCRHSRAHELSLSLPAPETVPAGILGAGGRICACRDPVTALRRNGRMVVLASV